MRILHRYPFSNIKEVSDEEREVGANKRVGDEQGGSYKISGSQGTSLPLSPLRTERAFYKALGSSKLLTKLLLYIWLALLACYEFAGDSIDGPSQGLSNYPFHHWLSD